jgi:hypothetical protein
MKIAAFGVWLACLVCACSGNKKSAPSPAGEATNPLGAPATANPNTSPSTNPGQPALEAQTSAGLCVTFDDIQVEPMDIEALEDEAPAVDIPAPVAKLLDEATATGSALEQGDALIVPLLRCSEKACVAGLATIDRQGRERAFNPLPGTESLPAGSAVRISAARADINSDGTVELWVGYQTGDPESDPSTQFLAALSWPALELLWHGQISHNSPVGTDRGCDGALYPIDADCDGDGDLVLVKRCGEVRCLNDDSEGCAAPEEQVAVFLFDAPAKAYREAPGKSP